MAREVRFIRKASPQKRELEYASRQLTTIEINGTYYGSQKPESFARWHEETPDGFVFTLKGPRFATNRRVLAEAGRFNWKILRQRRDPARKRQAVSHQLAVHAHQEIRRDTDFEAFLTLLLPKTHDGIVLRHAVEVRHDSFACAEFVLLCCRYSTVSAS